MDVARGMLPLSPVSGASVLLSCPFFLRAEQSHALCVWLMLVTCQYDSPVLRVYVTNCGALPLERPVTPGIRFGEAVLVQLAALASW